MKYQRIYIGGPKDGQSYEHNVAMLGASEMSNREPKEAWSETKLDWEGLPYTVWHGRLTDVYDYVGSFKYDEDLTLEVFLFSSTTVSA